MSLPQQGTQALRQRLIGTGPFAGRKSLDEGCDMSLDRNTIASIKTVLFPAEVDIGLYAIVDGAIVTGLRQASDDYGIDATCLLPGELDDKLANVAPYFFSITPRTDFIDWLLETSWGRHGGIFVRSSQSILALRQHFRALLTVYDAKGQPLLFRFYDPRVLQVYLPTCSAEQLGSLFGPADSFWLEGSTAKTVEYYAISQRALVTRQYPLT